jgi:ADP-ribose pyrophosphatase YjhB (NUDIX family)
LEHGAEDSQGDVMVELKAMCLFRKDGKLLVSKGLDSVKQKHFYRLLGGHVEFGETAEAGIRREIAEELASEIENLKLLAVIENIFTYEGRGGHEIDYLFSADLVNKDLYNQETIHVVENESLDFEAEWISLATILSGEVPVYPPFDYEALLK